MNTHVDCATGASGPRPSRVEDAAAGMIVVSWPTDTAGYRLSGRPGERVTVSWTSEWGVHEVSGTIAETESEPVPLWTVRALEAPPPRQRREAFRLEVRLPLVLHRRSPEGAAAGHGAAPGGDGTDKIEATVVDVSEGGLGFVAPAAAALERGGTVTAAFPLDDGEVTLTGTIVRLGAPRAGERGGGLRFDDVPEGEATRLRRFVLQEQIRRRAIVRD